MTKAEALKKARSKDDPPTLQRCMTKKARILDLKRKRPYQKQNYDGHDLEEEES